MTDSPKEHICASCAHAFIGNYCSQCGEKVLGGADRSFRSFLHQLIAAITFADNKLFKTLWMVISKPGLLSSEYAAGRRVLYMKPLSLFFVLNLIYFLFPVIQLFNASLHTQFMGPQRNWIQTVVAHKMIDLNIRDVNSFSLLYNQKTTALAKLLVMVFVVVASLPLNLLYRKRNRFFSDHIAFMVELASFNLIVNAIFLTVFVKVTGLGHYLDEVALTLIFISSNFYFLMKSGNHYYRDHGWKLVLRSVLMLLVLKAALEIYRAILFFVTLWTW